MWKASLTAAVLLSAAQVHAQEPKIYSYPSKQNYCPAGLQPVTFDGTISCGTPTQPMSYPAAMRHPVSRKSTRPVSRADCQPGVKGCD